MVQTHSRAALQLQTVERFILVDQRTRADYFFWSFGLAVTLSLCHTATPCQLDLTTPFMNIQSSAQPPRSFHSLQLMESSTVQPETRPPRHESGMETCVVVGRVGILSRALYADVQGAIEDFEQARHHGRVAIGLMLLSCVRWQHKGFY